MKHANWISGMLMTPILWLAACGGGEDARVKCTTTSQCGPSEQCEAGYCRPACTPGVDCPEKDGSTSDATDTDDAGPSDSEDGGEREWTGDDAQDAEDTDGQDTDASVPEDVTQVCAPDRTISALDNGKAFRVRFGDRESAQVPLPEGWTVAPACCTAGCCQ